MRSTRLLHGVAAEQCDRDPSPVMSTACPRVVSATDGARRRDLSEGRALHLQRPVAARENTREATDDGG